MLTGILSELQTGEAVLFLGAVCGFVTVLFTWLGGFLLQQLAQVTVAANFASRFAVNAVIFEITGDVQAQIHTMKAVLLLSNAGSAILGEVLRDEFHTAFSTLYFISAIATGLAMFCSGFLLSGKERVSQECQQSFSLKDATLDLVAIFRIPTVAWWTVWALLVNPAHGVALTYWQNLLKDIIDAKDRNGYMLGASYFAAAAVVAAVRRSSLLRAWTSLLVVGSVLSMGLLLLALTASHEELLFYLILVLIQCVFEVSAAVSTFQVGQEVYNSLSERPKEPRLALLFCITGVMSGALSSLVQQVHPISRRFSLAATVLLIMAPLLSLVACATRARRADSPLTMEMHRNA